MDSTNPFIYSRAVIPAEFLGREPELRRLFSRLGTRQSTAIIGQPHIGKTSLLMYVLDAKVRQASFGARFDRDLFSFLDAQTLHGVHTQAGFWELALAPLADCLQTGQPNYSESLVTKYGLAQENKFGTFVVEQLLNELGATGSRLVLLLDEFDDFLSHPVLNSAEFYGGLRSLASRSEGLVLVIAARRDLEQLNQVTQAINPHGSAYFNVFVELTLGPFSEKAVSELLDRAGDRFNRKDRHYVTKVSARHPYLAQAAAAMLWDADEEGLEGMARYREAGRKLYRETKKHFADTWNSWTNETRKAATAVALAQIPGLLAEHAFLASELIKDLDDYRPELEMLEATGLLAERDQREWSITQCTFLWWLADELRRNVRKETDFRTWLQAQEMDGLFTNQERQRMGKAVKGVLAAAGKGATTLIEAVAKSVSGGVT